MSEHYDRVVAALPHLTPAERERVGARLKALQSLAPAGTLADASGAFDNTASRPGVDELLDAIAGCVMRMAGERVAPAAMRRSSQFRAFAAKAEELHAFAVRHAPDRVNRRALLDIGLEFLYRDLAAAGFAVTSRVMMQCVHQLPAVLDKAFPGYGRSGVLGMLVNSRSRRMQP